MNSSKPNALARVLRGFFADHLPRVRGSSPHTVLSYRDTLVLFLRFVADRRKRSVSQLDLGDLDPPEVLAFLEHLEMKRKAIEQARPTDFGSDGPASWRTDASILDWLEGL